MIASDVTGFMDLPGKLAIPIFRTDAESLYEAYTSVWTQWAGPCKQLVIDNASALCSEKFAHLMQGQDTHLRVVAAYAHWQVGKTERHGENYPTDAT